MIYLVSQKHGYNRRSLVCINESTHADYLHFHILRTGRGGGVAASFLSGLLINTKPVINYNSLILSFSSKIEIRKKHFYI